MAKVYVGNIDRRTDKRDLEQEFGRYGKIRQIQIWADRHPAGFAFVEFEDDRDAEDAIKDLDDKNVLGSRLRVEWARSTGRKPATRRRFGSPGSDRGGGGRGGGGERRRRSPSPKRRRSSRSRSPAPKRRSPSPRRRSPSPRRKSPSPRRRSPSPRRRSPSPRRRSPSPRRKSASPRRSPTPK